MRRLFQYRDIVRLLGFGLCLPMCSGTARESSGLVADAAIREGSGGKPAAIDARMGSHDPEAGELAGRGGDPRGGSGGVGGASGEMGGVAGGTGGEMGTGGANGGTSGATGNDGGVIDPGPSDDPPLPACVRTVMVTTDGALANAIAGATPGDCILLGDGNYTMQTVTIKGTAAHPIVIRAVNRGKAVATSGSLAVIGASYVVIEGLRWTSSGSVNIKNSDNIRLSRCRFTPQEVLNLDWVSVGGTSNNVRIDHNDFGPKSVLGNMISLGGAGVQIVANVRIDHNYFHDITKGAGNGWETIKGGVAGLALSSGHTLIESNLFKACGGDPETISIKSSDSIVRYNTLLATAGEITLRLGNRNQVYGNFILGTGEPAARGIRVCGQDHKIYNNYVQDTVSEAIVLEGGDSDVQNEAGTAHYRVYRANVIYNTAINTAGISIGGGHEFKPVDCTIANNLVQGSKGALLYESGAAVNPRYEGNIVNPLPGAEIGLALTAAEIRMADPMLTMAGPIFRIGKGSPVIDAARGSYPFVVDDMDGQPRQKPDVGADEWSDDPTTRHPLGVSEVGPDSP